MKWNLWVASAIVLLAACKSKDANSPESGTVKLSGKIAGVESGYLEMMLPSNENQKVDSIKIEKGAFEYKFDVKEPELVMVRLAGSQQGGELAFFADPGKVVITGNKDSLWTSKIDGGPNQKLMKEAEVKVREIMMKGQALYPSYMAAQQSNDAEQMQKIEAQFIEIQQEAKNYAISFARQHRESPMAAYLGLIYLNEPGSEKEMKSLYDTLTAANKKTFFARKMNELVTASAATTIGAPAPEFTMNDQNGNPVSLSSFKGKYVLLDFWASWCMPCRQENPNVVKAYNSYKDKNFTILGVSLDKDKDAWVKAIADDKLAWTHVSDLSDGNNAAARLYRVNAIPANFLLDPQGNIIARDLRGPALEAALAQYVK